MGKVSGENRVVERRDAGRGDSHQYFPVCDHWFRKIDELQLFITIESVRSHCTHAGSSLFMPLMVSIAQTPSRNLLRLIKTSSSSPIALFQAFAKQAI